MELRMMLRYEYTDVWQYIQDVNILLLKYAVWNNIDILNAYICLYNAF